jgi:hypothetical protein
MGKIVSLIFVFKFVYMLKHAYAYFIYGKSNRDMFVLCV